MKKVFDFMKDATVIVASISSIIVVIMGCFGILTKTLCLPYWLIFIIVVTPYFVYKVIEIIIKTRRRKFKTGDIVSILGDKRDFIVFDYKTWNPDYVKIKRVNGDMALCVHQKFLTEFKGRDITEESLAKISGKEYQVPSYSAVIHRL